MAHPSRATGAKIESHSRAYTEEDFSKVDFDRLVVDPEIKSPITAGEYVFQLGLITRRLKMATHPDRAGTFQLSIDIDPNKLFQSNMEILADFLQARNRAGKYTTYTVDQESTHWINFEFTSRPPDSEPGSTDVAAILLRMKIRAMGEKIGMIEEGIVPFVNNPWANLNHFHLPDFSSD